MVQSQKACVRTIVLCVIFIPVIIYLLYFAYKKNTESAARADHCQQQCAGQGYTGYDFKWAVFSGPQCECLGEQSGPTE